MLFCKPNSKTDILYEYSVDKGQILKFRSLVLKKDPNILHHWVNQPYAKFWQLEGPVEKLHSTYNAV